MHFFHFVMNRCRNLTSYETILIYNNWNESMFKTINARHTKASLNLPLKCPCLGRHNSVLLSFKNKHFHLIY